VHRPRATHDRIHRAGLDAQRASDAQYFINFYRFGRVIDTENWIQLQTRLTSKSRKQRECPGAAWRATVNRNVLADNRLRIRQA
jgi:hypothetical protein